MEKTKQISLGAISITEIYPLPVFKGMAGLNAWAMRQARRRGLKIKTVGRRKFVTGADWAEYLAALEN